MSVYTAAGLLSASA